MILCTTPLASSGKNVLWEIPRKWSECRFLITGRNDLLGLYLKVVGMSYASLQLTSRRGSFNQYKFHSRFHIRKSSYSWQIFGNYIEG